MKRREQSGFTLIEVLLSITLVAAISAGMLTAMRSGLLTLNRTQQRLDENRVALGIQDLVHRQIGGAMPVQSLCANNDGQGKAPVFRGDAGQMVLVSSVSMAEGARGAPRVLRYQVQPNTNGTVRLVVYEQPFAGPPSTLGSCDPQLTVIPRVDPSLAPYVLFDNLAYCRISYRDLNWNNMQGATWLDSWVQPFLPFAVRIDMEAAPRSAGAVGAGMPVGAITIPLHITRRFEDSYVDQE